MNLERFNKLLKYMINISTILIVLTLMVSSIPVKNGIRITLVGCLLFVVSNLIEFFKDDKDYIEDDLIKEIMLLVVNIGQPINVIIALAIYDNVFPFKDALFYLITLIIIIFFTIVITFLEFIKFIKMIINHKNYTKSEMVKEILYLLFIICQILIIAGPIIIDSFGCGC